MEVKNKLNLINYSLGTIINAVIVYLLASETSEEFYLQLSVVICAALNQIMLIKGTLVILDPNITNKKGLKSSLYIFGKTLILGLSFYIIATNAPHKLLNAVIIYIFQLIILALSIKKDSV